MSFNVTVIGIGAMGGGMAHALLQSSAVSKVTGYDRSTELVKSFWEDAKAVGKAPEAAPASLSQATASSNAVLIVLVNQVQCEAVCFGSGDESLVNLLPKESTVILCSTVTATWAKEAARKFEAVGVKFVDCPISGGPVRARAGDLSLMASGDAMEQVMPLLDALGRDVHKIEGGVGMGSTVKMVHQLLAGVHICAAAEALALAAKAGLDPQQMYDIVNGAAGASWMFKDRGQRMMLEDEPKVMSALMLFVKDLDIVHSEAKALQSPIPVASAALQQFISGQSLGLERHDDSQVVKVYENITGVPVSSKKKEGSEVGDYWKLEDGSLEQIVEVGSEPRHKTVLSNEYVRALRVSFPPNDTTLAHRHAEDSLYFFLVDGGLDVVNHVQGSAPACDCMGFGEVRFGQHKTEGPLVHKITNTTKTTMLCVDAEVLQQPPVTSAIPLVAPHHECIKTREKCRVYKLTLKPGESVTVTYAFFFLTVILKPSTVKSEIGSSGPGVITWSSAAQVGDVAWHQPVSDLTQTNTGEEVYEAYIAEWR